MRIGVSKKVSFGIFAVYKIAAIIRSFPRRKIARLFLLIILIPKVTYSFAQNPKIYWSFEKLDNQRTQEDIGGKLDTLEGSYMEAPGVRGKALRLDGFTACLKGSGTRQMEVKKELTLEGWIALGEYPWNWCPLLTTESDEVKGYRLMIGPLGQASMEAAIGEQWICCTSEQETLPLRKWMHVVGVYRANSELVLYINGELKASCRINGSMSTSKSNYLLGMVAFPGKPSDIHRTWGTVPAYYGIDGILDEVKVYDVALSEEQIKNIFASATIKDPNISPRKLPTIEKHPGRFGAFYTKLKYYPGWDNLWPVADDPDIVVCFDRSPVKLVFWRGIRYGASWVSENENWMTDQSVEAWEDSSDDREGCFEHMQDRHCRFSHVRIIENNDARVVVHWRYAPVSAYDHTWRPDPKTGWECWIDEYYYIYPDGSAIRKVSWKKGTLGFPRQFQESLALLHPGQKVSDLLEKDYAYVADYTGRIGKESFVENPNIPPYGPFDWNISHAYSIQQFNFKSENKPFICFEPENQMWIRHEGLDSYDKADGCNHFPVGQARCDGRTTRTSDKPSHCTSFPISEPVIHENSDREYWNGLYGMNQMTMNDLIKFGKSWAYPPDLIILDADINSNGYDKSERCYQLENLTGRSKPIVFNLGGNKESVIINPAIYVKNWNSDGAKVLVDGQELKDCRIGINHELEGTDLVAFLTITKNSRINVRIIPQ